MAVWSAPAFGAGSGHGSRCGFMEFVQAVL